MQRLLPHILLFLVIAGAPFPGATIAVAEAQEMTVPAELLCSIFKKVLSYDRRNARLQKPALVIAIVYQSGFRRSITAQEEFAAAVEKTSSTQVEGKRVRCVAIDLDEEGELTELLAEDSVDAIYVAPIRSYELNTIVTAARTLRVMTMSGVPEYCERGIAAGIGVHADHPQLILNVTALKEAGAEMNAQVLRVAKVIQ
jgi:hypothetical protein